MNKLTLPFIPLLFLLMVSSAPALAETVCASVKIEILQELTLERVAFDAKLVITNSIPDKSLENVRVDVFIKDATGAPKDAIFFVRKPTLTNMTGVDGTGTVAAGARGEAHWLIVPSSGAGILLNENGTLKQAGVDYYVGATLTYTIGGVQEVVPINPDKIVVKPMPQLVLDYFMPYQVLGDNPFTTQVEAPVPYPLALRVMNDGYGSAMKLKIDSAQPVIKDNKQGLLVSFKILGASVNDSAVMPSLTVDFGDLLSKKASTASWQMISTLSGVFTSFTASFSHASELGGELTSLIRETNAHYLTHMIKVNLPGRDNRLDFLADTDKDADHLPDTIFESEIPNGGTDMAASKSPVTVVLPLSAPARPTPQAPNVTITLSGGATGWIYTKMNDPSQGLLKLEKVVRADGVQLNPHNYWIDQGLDQNYKKTYTLQFVDFRSDANTIGSYTLYFTQPDVDTTPPSTTVIFDGPATGGEVKYITPQTQIVFTATDNDGGSGVDAMYKRVAGQETDFIPAVPFRITAAGSHTIEYYSVDRAGNIEVAKTLSVMVDNGAPTVSSYGATPATIIPQAPRGVAAPRSITFSISATDDVPTLPVTVEIINQSQTIIKKLTGTAQAGTPLTILWDARDESGNLIPSGEYTVRFTVTDGLGSGSNDTAHTTVRETTISATDWFTGTPVDPNPAAAQMYPKTTGTKVVWQDQRKGNWDIYLKDAAATEAVAARITTNAADQGRPAMDDNIIVWQDYRNGNWDIFGFNTATQIEFPICTEPGDQERPVVAGDWVAWQDKRVGNWDIFAYKISLGETVRITSHERDQLRPAISGTTVAWEDYRHGLGEVYLYDLASGTETRRTIDNFNQTFPVISGSRLVWTDQRNDQKDIYAYDPEKQALRITYGTGDHTQASLLNNLLVYTDFEAGPNDPNLSFFDLSSGVGGRLTSLPSRQEEPSIGTDLVFWQDDRDGIAQIYSAPFAVEPLPIEAEVKPGFNLVAVGNLLKSAYPTASALLSADLDGVAIEKLVGHDPLHNLYFEAVPGGDDFSLTVGMGLIIYARSGGVITLAERGETANYTLLPGANQIGILTVPYGYSAFDLMRSVGFDNIQSVRRFDTETGAWQTVAVKGTELAGSNFSIHPGDGLIVTMKKRVDGWMP